ncbi:Uncharacterised protein [Kocuria rosea]|nr:Uncharacterised protein [Kocuria rosea]
MASTKLFRDSSHTIPASASWIALARPQERVITTGRPMDIASRTAIGKGSSVDGRAKTLACRIRSRDASGGIGPNHWIVLSSPLPSMANCTALPSPSSGPTRANLAFGCFLWSEFAASTMNNGLLRVCNRDKKRTSGSVWMPCCCSNDSVPVSGTPFASWTRRRSMPATSVKSLRSRSVRYRTVCARRRTRRVKTASRGMARGLLVRSIMPCVCTTNGFPARRPRTAAGSVTKSLARCTWTTSAPFTARASQPCMLGDARPAKPVPGRRCRPLKRLTGNESNSSGSGPSNPPAAPATTTWCPSRRRALAWFSATRTGPP